MPVPIRIPWLLIMTAALVALAALFVRPATADQEVSVALLDVPFAIIADPAAAPAGTVTFNAWNVGAPYSYLPHNLVVIDTDLPPNQLPLTLDNQYVDLAQLDVLGQTAEFLPGETQVLQLSMPPGNYVLICNNAAYHYTAGMYTPFQVTGTTPTASPTPTSSPTPKPTATPKNPGEDTDGDTLTNDIDPNDDNDSCTDVQELGDNPALGGQRNPHNFWDFYDVPTGAGLTRDGNISSLDIFQVLGRFNATDVGPGDFDRNSNPWDTTPNPISQDDRANYHPAYDRGPLVGWKPWDLGPADGSIAALDIFAVLAQFGHSCS